MEKTGTQNLAHDCNSCSLMPCSDLPDIIMAKVAAQAVFLVSLLVMSFWAQSEASVTVLNGALIPVDVLVAGKHVHVQTGLKPVSVDVKGKKEQTVSVSMGKGKKPVFVNVKDGDTVVIIPDILGGGMINVNVNGVLKGHF